MDGELTLHRTPGGIEVVNAPRVTGIALDVLAGCCRHTLQVHGDRIVIADQVVYQVTGWQASPPALTVTLLEDLRARARTP